jgi:PAS domain S-box-containing protein
MDEAFVSLDRDLRITRVNGVVARFNGLTPEAMVGRLVNEVWPPDVVGPHLDANYRRVIEEQTPVRFEHFSVVRRRWIEISAYPSLDSGENGGAGGGVNVFFRDITEQRRLERELAQREQDYAALIENSPDVLARFDREGRFLYINEQGTRNTGIPREAFLGRTFREIGGLPEENVQQWERALSEVFSTGEPRHVEYGFPTPGGYGYFECELIPDFGRHSDGGGAGSKDKTVQTVLTVTRNVTDRRLLEKERETQHQRQRRFMREMVFSLTEGRLTVCESEADLPAPLPPVLEEVELFRPSLRLLRKQVEAVAQTLHMPMERAQDLESATGEAAMNAVVHAGGGTGRVHADTASGTIQVWVRDAGGGISDESLPRALEKGVSSAGTLGHGFSLILKTADRIWLLTGTSGTTVVLEQHRDAPEPAWLQTVT